MKEKLLDKLVNIHKSWIFWILVITLIAIIIRSIPAWTNEAWGSDFGIYFGLTKDLIKTGELYNPYYGWGSSYNFFPVLYSISGLIHVLSGIDLLTVMTNLAPIVGGLTVLVFYFLVYELLKNKKIAVISALLLSVLPFHVYQLSHAAPLTMGHFFMVLSLYFFVKFRKRTIFVFPLFISTLLLVMSHHLTTYFYLISLVFITFFENASSSVDYAKIKKDIFYLISTSVLIFSYWAFIATPVYEGFMNRGINLFGINIGSTLTLLLFYFMLLSSFIAARFVKRFSNYIKAKQKNNESKNLIWFLYSLNPFIVKEKPSVKSRIYLFMIALISYIVTLLIFVTVPLPWQGFPLNFEAIILITPFLIALAFALSGFRYTSRYNNGFFIRGWTIGLLFSLLYAMMSNNTILLPHRHFEYLMYPIAILTVFGIGSIFSDPDYKNIFFSVKKNIRAISSNPKKNISRYSVITLVFITLLIVTNAASIYPTHESLNESFPHVRDKIFREDFSVVEWMGENVDKNYSVVVSDHCIERLLESEDFQTSEDKTSRIWFENDTSDCLEELYGTTKEHNKITHVVIDKLMKENYVQYGLDREGTPLWSEITNESFHKFNSTNAFNLIYRNESTELDPITKKPMFWAEVYKVNWTYIEKMVS